jgi:hypothetical protein
MTQEFEAVAQSNEWGRLSIEKRYDGRYSSSHTALAYTFWQASREQLRLEMLKIMHPEGIKHPQQAEIDSLLDKVRQLAGLKAKLLSDDMVTMVEDIIDIVLTNDGEETTTRNLAKAALEAAEGEL